MNYTSRIWRRINFAIDLLVVIVLWFILMFLITLIFSPESLTSSFVIEYIAISIEPSFFLTYFLYFLIMESVFSRTVGKYITGTVVVNNNKEKPGFVNILIRSLIRFIPIDWFTFFKPNPTGWHDSLSKTFVINKEKVSSSA